MFGVGFGTILFFKKLYRFFFSHLFGCKDSSEKEALETTNSAEFSMLWDMHLARIHEPNTKLTSLGVNQGLG